MFRNIRQFCLLQNHFNQLICSAAKGTCVISQSTSNTGSKLFSNCQSRIAVLVPAPSNMVKPENVRFKSKDRKIQSSTKADDESTDEEESDDESGFDEDGGKLKTLKLKSLRLDGMLKSCFGLTRRRAEEVLMTNKIRLNGNTLQKKSVNVNVGDEIELYADSTDGDVESKSLGKVVIKKIKPGTGSDVYVVMSAHKG